MPLSSESALASGGTDGSKVPRRPPTGPSDAHRHHDVPRRGAAEAAARIQASGGDASWSETHADVITEKFLLNPEHPRHRDTGDSAAGTYGAIVPMMEGRNLARLGGFVHDLV